MTDRLKTLLLTEAETLEVPPVPAEDILGAGRRLRRRRTGTIWTGVAVVAALVAVVTGVARDRGRDEPAPVTGAGPAVTQGALAWAVDDLVHVAQDGRVEAPARMPEVAQTLYYTSAGILVRTNKDGSSDGGAPFHFSLIGADGSVAPVDVTLGEVVPSTDPSEPYLAWATRSGGRTQVVVHDVVSGRDVARVDVPGTFTWAGWDAPPVALSGDRVYVGNDDRTAVVNWRTGETTTTAVIPGSQVPEVSGGRTVVVHRQGRQHATADIVDAVTGLDLLDVPIAPYDQVTLSPDGRFAMVVRLDAGPTAGITVYDVGSPDHVVLPADAGGYGWSSGGEPFRVRGDRLTVCSPTSGSCDTTTIPDVGGHAFVRYSGLTYES